MSFKIKIGKVQENKVQGFLDAFKAGAHGWERNTETGELNVTLDMPGVKTMSFTREEIEGISEVVGTPSPLGASPAAVFTRTASEDSEGNLTARFSDEKRARSITVPASEREAFASILANVSADWQETEAEWAAMEAAANAAPTTPAE